MGDHGSVPNLIDDLYDGTLGLSIIHFSRDVSSKKGFRYNSVRTLLHKGMVVDRVDDRDGCWYHGELF